MARDTEERKQRIIDAAIEVIREKGVEKASIRDIAKQAGVTTGSIYHHYKSKDELFFRVVNQTVHFSNRVYEMDKSGYDSPEEVLSLIKGEVEQRLAKEDEQILYIQLLGEALGKGGRLREKHAENHRDIINHTADMFYDAYGIENSEYKRSLASFLVAALDGMAIQTALGVLPEDLDVSTMRFNDFFGQSIGAYLKDNAPGE